MTHTRKQPIQVFSEIGPLKEVMLHRPGKELENLVPDYLERLLFDEIPFLHRAQEEHDNFARVLEDKGVRVLYLEKLVAEAIDAAGLKDQFIADWLEETGLRPKGAEYKEVRQLMTSYTDTLDLVLKSMEGIKKSEIAVQGGRSLADILDSDYPFLVDPMPNLYFTRDPFATLGHGVSINHMYAETRNRETLYGQYIFQYHPRYKGTQVPSYYGRHLSHKLEGGDILVLSPDTLAIGISQRTGAQGIELLAENLFKNRDFKQVLAFSIANNRKFMHLDTVFTMLDIDKFTIHPEIEGDLRVYQIQPNPEGGIKIQAKTDTLDHILANALGLDQVQLFRCGGDDMVAAAREQWNDGANTLAIAPGEIIVYERNTVTNALLDQAGIKLHPIPASELVRGRGGPRCMSMPFRRDPV